MLIGGGLAVFVTGISRGGHLTWDLALRHPDLWAGCIPMIGGPRITMQNGQNNLRYLDNVVHLPIRDLQGSGDHPLLPVLEMSLSDEARAACDELVPPGSCVANFHNTADWMKMRVL